MRAHLVENGKIVNTIEVESLSILPNLVAARGNEGIGWVETSGTFVPPPEIMDRAALALEIDKAADALRLSIVGDPLRVEEYRIAREEATAFVAANYSGTVPSSVQSWATAKSWTPKQSADDIMHTAQLWSSALYAIRTIRLTGKEAVRNAADATAANTAYQTALGQLTALKGAM